MQIDFHTHVGDKVDYACRLARRAYTAGELLLVTAEAALLEAFDTRLWTFAALEFIPHCRLDDARAAATPVVLAAHFDSAPPNRMLLNLGAAVPPDFACFKRLLEVVGNDADDLAAARERYRFYRERGHPLNNYKRSGESAGSALG